jgi:hypothetical protein
MMTLQALAFLLPSAAVPAASPTVLFRSNFTEPSWVAIYHIPVLLAVPINGSASAPQNATRWRMLAFAEARQCNADGATTCDPAQAPDDAPKGLAFRHSDWAATNSSAATTGWVPSLGTPPRFLYRDTHSECCMNLGAAVFEAVTRTVFLHFVVGYGQKSDQQILLFSPDFGDSWQKHPGYSSQLKAAGFSKFAPGPGIGVQFMQPTSFRHRLLICGQGKARGSAVCIASDNHGSTWMGAGGPEVEDNSTLPSEASLAELTNGSLLLNTRNSCHRLPKPHNCCWGPGCFDRAGVPHCHGPKVCDHSHDNHHTRILSWSHDGGKTFSEPTWCPALPDPDCEGSMARDVSSGELLFSNNKNGTIGNRNNMTLYRSGGDGACSSWREVKQVNVGPAGYSCITSLPQRRVGIMYEHAWSAGAVARNDRDRTNLVFELVHA